MQESAHLKVRLVVHEGHVALLDDFVILVDVLAHGHVGAAVDDALPHQRATCVLWGRVLTGVEWGRGGGGIPGPLPPPTLPCPIPASHPQAFYCERAAGHRDGGAGLF